MHEWVAGPSAGEVRHVTWALKDRSGVNRTFWEWSPEGDSLLKLRMHPSPSDVLPGRTCTNAPR